MTVSWLGCNYLLGLDQPPDCGVIRLNVMQEQSRSHDWGRVRLPYVTTGIPFCPTADQSIDVGHGDDSLKQMIDAGHALKPGTYKDIYTETYLHAGIELVRSVVNDGREMGLKPAAVLTPVRHPKWKYFSEEVRWKYFSEEDVRQSPCHFGVILMSSLVPSVWTLWCTAVT